MFNVEVRFSVDGRYVSVHGFLEALLAEIRKAMNEGIQKLPQGRPVVGELSQLQREEGERKAQKPLAVGVDEAGKLLGLSPWTIRRYIAEGQIRSVRVGRRVLVPMDVLEKVMVEGVSRQ